MQVSSTTSNSYYFSLYIAHFAHSFDLRDAGVRFKHPYDRGIRQNFEEVFGPYPWYLMLLPSVREPPVVVFPPMPDLFPPKEYAAHEGEGSGQEEEDYHGHEEVLFNGYARSHAASNTTAPRWEHNTHNVVSDAEAGQASDAEESHGLIRDRPQEAGAAPGVTPRSVGASSSRKATEVNSAWDDKSS